MNTKDKRQGNLVIVYAIRYQLSSGCRRRVALPLLEVYTVHFFCHVTAARDINGFCNAIRNSFTCLLNDVRSGTCLLWDITILVGYMSSILLKTTSCLATI